MTTETYEESVWDSNSRGSESIMVGKHGGRTQSWGPEQEADSSHLEPGA